MSTHKKQTNQTHRVTLPSSIEQVRWTRSRAAPGGKVGLDISTRYVGNGVGLTIKLTDRDGSTHGTFRDQIYNNRLTAEVEVPSAAAGALFAEVTFPEHWLSQTSSPLFLTDPVAVRRATWSQDAARRGDVLTLSADVIGAPEGRAATVDIFEHDQQGAHDPITTLSTRVENGRVEVEWQYEYNEDTDRIPTGEEREKEYRPPTYFFRVEVDGIEGESDLLPFQDWVEFKLLDAFGEGMSEVSYVLHLPNGKTRTGTLDEKGAAYEEEVPPGEVEVEYPNLEQSVEKREPSDAQTSGD